MSITPPRTEKDDQLEERRESPLSPPHIGMRKMKSILAIFVGFCFWQTLRLFLPELETHPIFIYIYGMMEIRETSDKTKDYGRMRIIVTFAAILVGLPMMLAADSLRRRFTETWMHTLLEIAVLLLGTLVVLCVAEWIRCQAYCGLAAAIYIILVITHFDSSMYLYSIMRAIQTIIGVFIAWVINVKLLPYPPTPGSLSYWLAERRGKNRES